MTDKVRENRLRRAAERQGYILEKSRRRDARARGFGKYRLIDHSSDRLAPDWEDPPFLQTLDDIERVLLGMDE